MAESDSESAGSSSVINKSGASHGCVYNNSSSSSSSSNSTSSGNGQTAGSCTSGSSSRDCSRSRSSSIDGTASHNGSPVKLQQQPMLRVAVIGFSASVACVLHSLWQSASRFSVAAYWLPDQQQRSCLLEFAAACGQQLDGIEALIETELACITMRDDRLHLMLIGDGGPNNQWRLAKELAGDNLQTLCMCPPPPFTANQQLLAKRSSLNLIGCSYRHLPAVRTVRQQLAGIGRLYAVRVNLSCAPLVGQQFDWAYDCIAGGGVLAFYGGIVIDLVQQLVNSTAVKAKGLLLLLQLLLLHVMMLVSMIIMIILCGSGQGSEDEVKLVNMLFDHRSYNRLIRPVPDLNRTVKVHLGLALVQLINVEEKSQIMKSNVWLRMSWYDYQLRWDPADFGGIRVIRVNPNLVWKPDIVLYNNADGKYEVSWQPNVLVFSTGSILWIPPAIYKSSCTIHVKYFPFDQQECDMKFGSWTFDATQVVLGYYEGAKQVDLNDYWKSGSWDIINCPGNITHIEKPGQPPQTMIIFKLTIRRKTLFYTVNLIIPCVLISLLSVCVFYLPADAGEKMTLCISILLALVVFLLLVSKILPPTSISIPLISKFLLFTFIMNIITIVFTVIIINWNSRTPRTHQMPRWVRILFLKYLPIFLFMKRPEHIDEEEERRKARESKMAANSISDAAATAEWQVKAVKSQNGLELLLPPAAAAAAVDENAGSFGGVRISPDLRKAVASINFISNHLRVEDQYKRVLQDWKYVASVIDRIQLVIFTTVTVIGTIAILMNAPFVLDFVDQDEVIRKLTAVT